MEPIRAVFMNDKNMISSSGLYSLMAFGPRLAFRMIGYDTSRNTNPETPTTEITVIALMFNEDAHSTGASRAPIKYRSIRAFPTIKPPIKLRVIPNR